MSGEGQGVHRTEQRARRGGLAGLRGSPSEEGPCFEHRCDTLGCVLQKVPAMATVTGDAGGARTRAGSWWNVPLTGPGTRGQWRAPGRPWDAAEGPVGREDPLTSRPVGEGEGGVCALG